MNLSISPWQVVWPRVVLIAGLSMLFAPLNVAAFIYIPKELRGAAVGLLALLRNEGGSVGTSVGQIILDRRQQFHTLRLNEALEPFNPASGRSSTKVTRSSCSNTAIRWALGKWRYKHLKTCTINRRCRWLTSTFFGSSR